MLELRQGVRSGKESKILCKKGMGEMIFDPIA